MSYKDLIGIKREYRTKRDDVVMNFYTPLLKEAILYKRATGFFSSSALVQLTKGLSSLIRNQGKMQLIVSPILSKEDISEIQHGYSLREKVEEKIFNSIVDPESDEAAERLSWIAYMIANNILDIKVAYFSDCSMGIYHEKVGIFYDGTGYKVAFSGSLNETSNAFSNNYESFDVYKSWNAVDFQRVLDKEAAFDALWENNEPQISVINFPEASKKKILQFRRDSYPNFHIDDEVNNPRINKGIPVQPSFIKLYDFQKEAIDKWETNNFKGIFDMATGTGKTITGLAAITRLYSTFNQAAVIIVCPYQHLVEQWRIDIEDFNITPIVGYSSSDQRDWRDRLKDTIIDYNLGIIDFFCFITTNATFSLESVQKKLAEIEIHKTLVVDEAHNFGAIKISKLLNDSYKFRLALSATIERHKDPEGTEILKKFFGEKCIEYGIERAITESRLTPYYYYPVTVLLEDYEYKKYAEISRKISRLLKFNEKGEISNFDQVKMMLIQRSRIIAGASNKIKKLKELMEKYRDESHILIYCGATRILKDDESFDEFGQRQIIEVSKMLGNELNIINTQFTSQESSYERGIIKERFANRNPYQAIVAIKCLDEGVNIPSIRTAFILASSTNPKEYIQRRGRVLRTFPGKNYAEIYDFITLPHLPDSVQFLNETEKRYDISLIRKEIARIKEFGEISLNPEESERLVSNLISAYNLDLIKEDENYGDEI